MDFIEREIEIVHETSYVVDENMFTDILKNIP